ncbi:MAG: Stp1/IreP family PP2C-type Ser/Thr phosphatase [Clostridiaceae bacterium]|nr:Stp1/IreP family PP2C-type Ser/Thr phosphatase [Clostridiaceae bacterium]
MRAFAKSDIGKAREMNQDYYYISKDQDPIQIFILADGMGGYNGGEIASKLATSAALNYIQSNFETISKEKEDILKLVKSSMEYANMVVYEKSNEDKNLEGMGTTLEVCLIYNNKVYIGHVGDSRVYRIRKDFIRKITHDHSYVEKLVKDGTITKEEANHHPKKNMLMKALGCRAFVEPDVTVKGFIKDDTILMCSDGLTNMVDEKEIYELIKENYMIATEKLIQKANENGGYDNITAIVIH